MHKELDVPLEFVRLFRLVARADTLNWLIQRPFHHHRVCKSHRPACTDSIILNIGNCCACLIPLSEQDLWDMDALSLWVSPCIWS